VNIQKQAAAQPYFTNEPISFIIEDFFCARRGGDPGENEKGCTEMAHLRRLDQVVSYLGTSALS
jgi:hypothetical protein